jgi:predicted chitinase
MLTREYLKYVVPSITDARIALYLRPLNDALDEFDINTGLRQAAFLAQIAHESGGFIYTKELWGPTAQQLKYEPPSTLASILGNTRPGDGRLYCGRGLIQLTGRANYQKAGSAIGVDLLSNPEILSQPINSCRVAGWFWKSKNINDPADAGDFEQVTRRVNGGLNGYDSRLAYYNKALEWESLGQPLQGATDR